MLRNTYQYLLVLTTLLPLLFFVDCRSSYSQPQEISTTELQAIMGSGQEFALINVLPKIIYDSMHLPGSINLPIGTLEELSALPFPKNLPLIFYCMGYLWVYSPRAASLAERMGYSDVRIYRHGIIGWAKSGRKLEDDKQYPKIEIPLVSSQTLAAKKATYQIIDIRPEAHFVKGHIAGAKNIDLEELHLRYTKLIGIDKVILVDHKGKLTLTTGRYLHSKGITNVSRLDGGFNAWVKEGHHVSQVESK